ncbi:MAG: sugar ABC transporter permease [Proteobacteria bacterium]|nr:sugar ABC transporter permease [Pseudomonadota bacterium]
MGVTRQVPADGRSTAGGRRRRAGHGLLHSSDFIWTVAFLAPYAAVFLAFVLYPVVSGLWMGSAPSLYAELVEDPLYVRTLVNTALFVGVGVNLKMFLALLLSGFFMRRRWWIKATLVIFILPWALPAIPAFLSIHWMLIGEQGFLDSLLLAVIGVDGPIWFNDRWLALGSNIVAYIWKWLPFWTVILLAGRMAIPQELHEAADVDGATGIKRFVHVTFPLLANIYLVCTLLSTIWTLGDFTTVFYVSGGAPARSSEVLSTISVRYAFTVARPSLGVAAALSSLPVLIPLVIMLMRRLQTRGVQL